MSEDIARFTDTDPDAERDPGSLDPRDLDPRDLDPDELDLEAPENDVADQRTEVLQTGDEPLVVRPGELEFEADPADAVEQRRVVAVDDEDGLGDRL